MSRTTIGLFAGLLIAIATAVGGFFGFLAAIVFGAVGLGVGKILDGDLDISSYLGGNGRRPR
ncbi:hypothetical protein GCM10009765_32190 [Fodinicola feengrottensis]|uniref:DUF2273 domain-containing protein n=1 Tax=Fodinicola feengrottensis TaxID=435914 RepID=A0ABP4T103_9ACTN